MKFPAPAPSAAKPPAPNPAAVITEAGRREAVLKAGALQNAILNSANFSNIATDERGVIQSFNVGAERMLGYAAADVLNKITPADLSDPQELIARAETLSREFNTPITPGFEALVFKAARGIEDIYELTRIRKDGSRFPATVSVTALRDAGEEIIGYLLIGTDNTARQQAEEEQKKLDQLLRDQQAQTRTLLEANADTLKALRASELRYRRLFETAKDGILILDAVTGMVVDVNPFLITLLGYSHEQFLGKAIWELGFFKDIVANEEKFAELREKEYLRYENMPLETVDGRRIEVEFVSNVYLVNGDKVIQCNIRDVSARRKAEEAVRRSEERFAGAFAHAPSGVALVAPDGRWLMVNRALCDLLGYSEAELLNRTFQDITHPEDLAADLENVRRLLAGEIRTYQMEKRYLMATGQVVPVMLYVSLVRDSAGRPSYFISHIQDIMARKQSEATLHREQALLNSLIATIPDHIYIKDRQSRFIRINDSMAQRIGLRDPAEAIGKSDLDYFTAEHAEPAHAQDQGLMTTGEPIIGLEEKETWTDGLVTWASTTKVPLRDPAGEIVGLIGISRDITAAKQAGALLEQSRQRLAVATESAHIGIWELDVVANALIWDAQMYVLYGIRESDFGQAYDAWQNGVHPDDRQRSDAEIKAAAVGIGGYHSEFRVVWPGGEVRVIEVHAMMQDSADGPPHRMVGVNWDITERRQAEEAQRASKKRLRDLIDGLGATMMVGLLTPEGILVEANAPALAAVGLKAKDVLGKPLVDSRWFAYSAEVQQRLRDAMERAHRGEASRYDMKIRGVDDREIDVDFALNLVRDEAGNIVFLVPSGNDITDRKRAETALRKSNEKFHQLANNITDAFWIRSPDMSEVDYVSPAFEKIWGRTVASLMANPQEWITFIVAEDRERVRTAFAALSDGTSTLEIEYRIVRPTGGIRWVRVRGFQVRNAAGEVIRHIGIVSDITESKQLNEHLMQVQKMEALGQFSGGVAHDFNNILAAISGYTELARIQLEGNPAVREHLNAVIKSANRAAELVRQILTFSRQESQTREVLLLQPIVVESMKLMRATIPSTVEIEAFIAADAPTVLANANQVHQLMMNLAINGWHALKNHSGRLQVKLEKIVVNAALAAANPELRPGSYACLSVSDTGCGMDQATLRRIFEPFFTTKPVGEGTGLGLAVVHGIMDAHDGAITVQSQPGEGTTFRLFFPEHIGATSPAAEKRGSTPHGQGECVLVVDDEEMLAALGANLLTRLGYTAEHATASEQALALVRSNPARYALVLSDQTMPGMTGLQLAGEIREIRPDLPVMLMSGYNLSLTTDRVGASGVRNILHKPFTIHSLGLAVHATLTGATFHDHGSNSPY